jgi:hypothetical protein
LPRNRASSRISIRRCSVSTLRTGNWSQLPLQVTSMRSVERIAPEPAHVERHSRTPGPEPKWRQSCRLPGTLLDQMQAEQDSCRAIRTIDLVLRAREWPRYLLRRSNLTTSRSNSIDSRVRGPLAVNCDAHVEQGERLPRLRTRERSSEYRGFRLFIVSRTRSARRCRSGISRSARSRREPP